jgi:hypothetical protein
METAMLAGHLSLLRRSLYGTLDEREMWTNQFV